MPSKGDKNTEDRKGKHHKKKKTKQISEEFRKFHSSSKHKQVDVDGSTKYHNWSDYEKEKESKQKRIKRKKERKITKSLRHIDSKHVEGLQKKTTLEFKENQENLKSFEQNDKKNHKSLKRKHIVHSKKKDKKMKTTSSECKDNIENLESFEQNGKKKHRSSKRKHVDDDEQPKKKKKKSLDYNENHENLHLLDQSSKKKHKSSKRKHADDDYLEHKKKHKSSKRMLAKKKKSLDYNENQENLPLLDKSSKKKHKSLKHADDHHLEHLKKKKKKKSLDYNENQENLQLLDKSSKKKHKSLKHADDDHLEHKKKHKSLKRMLAKKKKKSLDNNENQENLQLLDQSSKKKHKSLKHADDYHSGNTAKKTRVEYKDHQKHQPLLDENKSCNKSDFSMKDTTMVVESVKDQGEYENKQPMQKESEIFKVNDIHLKKQELFRESRKMKLADNEYENFILNNDLIHYIWKPNKDLRKKLGIREGKWTKKEECQLEENVKKFLQVHNIDDPMKLINMLANDKKRWRHFQNKTGFYQELLKGLNRSLSKVASKFLQFFDKKRYLGRYSKNEDEILLNLVAQGKRWTEIGIAIGRSHYSACNRHTCILIKDTSLHNTGPWQDDEKDRLRKAVRHVTNTQEGEEVHVYSGINWTKVSSIVKTRHAVYCRTKWLHEIYWKECKHFTDERIWSQENDVELIKRVYESQATEECDVNWFALIEYFKIACSSYWLRKKFLIIKRRYFSPIDLENKDFDEVIDHLYNVVAVDLQNKISQEQEKIAT